MNLVANAVEPATESLRSQFRRDGFVIARGLFTREEVARFRAHYFDLLESKVAVEGQAARDMDANDPLKQYPRLMMMHRYDELSLNFLCDARLNEVLTELTGFEPFAVQTMFYFKPAGARGQAMHQDNFYLRAYPSTCIAAWLAVDDCDEENGCLTLVPGSQNLPVMCLDKADTTKSFTDVEVPVPDGMEVRPAVMKAGDVLFFNGQVIHGSGPNVSPDRFRCSLIAHYVIGDSTAVSHWYHPVLRMNKSVVEFGESQGGGQCGEWVDADGKPAVQMVDASLRDKQLITE